MVECIEGAAGLARISCSPFFAFPGYRPLQCHQKKVNRAREPAYRIRTTPGYARPTTAPPGLAPVDPPRPMPLIRCCTTDKVSRAATQYGHAGVGWVTSVVKSYGRERHFWSLSRPRTAVAGFLPSPHFLAVNQIVSPDNHALPHISSTLPS